MAMIRRPLSEHLFEALVHMAALAGVAALLGILAMLVVESLDFFKEAPILEFLTGVRWAPLFDLPHYGILPLLAGTMITTALAMLVAAPLGIAAAVWLSEFAPPRLREVIKPVMEILAGVPTVIFGQFALLAVTPALQTTLLPDLPGFNLLSAGIVIGIMIVPLVASLSEDALSAVPRDTRAASLALGATSWETARRVVLPSAIGGVGAGLLLAFARAMGETMIVAMAGGQQPNLTLDPTQPAATITTYIVGVAKGDVPHDGMAYRSIFAAGLALFVLILLTNITGQVLRRATRAHRSV
ncbi:MAG: phosphate ABC transporter permease subunit PstC [Alphaproteobacteria bacterium]|nr:MAG: phosphate ABC transporter permease subunit PstC [Alphaproteobacteria bacterium]